MINRRISRQPHEELEFALHRLFTHILLIVDLIYASRVYRVINLGIIHPLILATCAGIVAFYAIYLLSRFRIVPVVIALAYICLVIFQISVFAEKLWIPVNVNVFFQYIWLLTFIPFAGICIAGGRDYLLKCAVGYGSLYCAFYAATSSMQMAGVLPGQILQAIVSFDTERGYRVFMYAGLVCLSYFYWLVQLKKKRSRKNIFFFTICLLASVLSLSRVYLFLLLSLTFLFHIVPRPALISFFARFVLLVGSAFVLSGILFPTINPFNLFGNDSSGSYRALEYVIMRQRIEMDPLWGFGLSPNFESSRAFLGPYPIFSTDIGPLGVWFDFGLIGLGLYFIALWFCSRPIRNIDYKFGWPLFLTGAMMAANGCISPVAVSEGGSTITGLIFGVGFGSLARARRHGPNFRRPYRRRHLASGDASPTPGNPSYPASGRR